MNYTRETSFPLSIKTLRSEVNEYIIVIVIFNGTVRLVIWFTSRKIKTST